MFTELSSFAVGATFIGLLLCFGFFALSGALLTRTRASRFADIQDQSGALCRGGRFVLQRDEYFLLSSQLGMFFSAFFAGISSLALVENGWLRDVLGPVIVNQNAAVSVAVIVAATITSIVILSLVQIIKARAFAHPEQGLCAVALPLMILTLPLFPVVFLLRGILAPLLQKLGVRPSFERELVLSADELNEVVLQSQREGAIGKNEGELLKGVVSFSDTIVREVMVPRKDIVTVAEDASLKEVLKVFLTERLSRLLVIGDNLDDVRGILLLKDLLPVVARGSISNFLLKDYIRPAYFVPNNRQIDYLLQAMRKDGIHLAVVLDEHGGVDGLVTIEDLIEEIVGEISDEYDSPSDEIEVYKTKSGELLVDGSMLLEDLNSSYGFQFPLGEYDTLAGFVVHLFGRIPLVGESAEYEGHVLKVERVGQNRITLVRVAPIKKISEGTVVELHPEDRNPPKELENKLRSSESSKVRILGSR